MQKRGRDEEILQAASVDCEDLLSDLYQITLKMHVKLHSRGDIGSFFSFCVSVYDSDGFKPSKQQLKG